MRQPYDRKQRPRRYVSVTLPLFVRFLLSLFDVALYNVAMQFPIVTIVLLRNDRLNFPGFGDVSADEAWIERIEI